VSTIRHRFSADTSDHPTPRLMFVCVLGSLLLHGLLLWLLPGAWRSEPSQAPAVLDVQLLAPPSAAPAAAASAVLPPREKTAARPNPEPAQSRPRAETPPPPVIATDAAQPAAADAADAARASTPTAPAAPAAPAAPSAARAETVTPPSFSAAYLRNPPPAYPAAARRNGEEGTVTLRVLVSAEGSPTRIELERSSGSRLLDAAAIEAVRGWRFQPARRGSQAIEDWALVPLRFRLDA
jgi:protein TonB